MDAFVGVNFECAGLGVGIGSDRDVDDVDDVGVDVDFVDVVGQVVDLRVPSLRYSPPVFLSARSMPSSSPF